MPNEPAPTGPGIPQITADHLKNNNPTVLNSVLRLISQQIAGISSMSGQMKISLPLNAQQITLAPQNTSVVPGENQAITFGLAKALFSPQAIKQSIINNTFLGVPVTSLPNGTGAAGLVIEDTHANRAITHAPSASAVGTLYFETDRTVWYLNQLVAGSQQWVYAFGEMSGTVVAVDQRPSDLGVNDNGFQFFATDLKTLLTWSSSLPGWVSSTLTTPTLQDTRAHRIANYPPTDYAIGQEFYETDTKLTYSVQKPVATLVWQYKFGTYALTQTNIAAFAATLGANDTGLVIYVSDYAHNLAWQGGSFSWAQTDPGDVGKMEFFDVDPTGVGWHLYDGSTVSYLKADGTLGSITLLNLVANPSFLVAGSPNTGLTGAGAPTFTGTPITFTTGLATLGAGSTVLTGPTSVTPAGTISATGTPPNITRRPFFRQ